MNLLFFFFYQICKYTDSIYTCINNFYHLHRTAKDPIRRGIGAIKYGFQLLFFVLSPTNIKNKINEMQQMTTIELIKSFFKLWFYLMFYTGYSGFYVLRFVTYILSINTRKIQNVKQIRFFFYIIYFARFSVYFNTNKFKLTNCTFF